ncbi:MAG: hypothetical protein MUC80_00485 [Candidatus Thermoplasmatota archaeon]|jgi:hypothetical protein|nr:hypothetical protein [Candidatus Thermoplasmatota archaeon]
MSIKKSRKIWLRNYSIFTSDKSVWESIEKKMETSIQDRQEKPKRGMDAGLKFDINYRLFFQLIGDIAAEYYFLGIYEIDPGIIIKKIEKYLYYLYEKKKVGGTPEKIKIIDKDKKAQFRQLRRIRFEDKTSQINNWFRKRGLDGDIFEEVETGFQLLVYSIAGPEKGSELKGPKKRVIEFGPYEDDVIKFCTSTMNPLDLKTWPDARSRFKKMIGELQSIIQIPKMLSKKIYHLQPLDQYLEKGVNKEPDFSRKIGPLWIDFESGYVVERDEVKNIINNFDGNQYQLLIGEAGSGKSGISRSVGYLLSKHGWNVYVLTPESFYNASWLAEIKEEIEALENKFDKTLVIIEDIHRNSLEVTYLLERIQNKNTRFLATGRKSFEDYLPENKRSLFNGFIIKKLEQEDFVTVAHNLISIYLEKENGRRNGSFIRISQKQCELIIEEAKGNLWVLAYLLKGWVEDKGVSKEILYEEVKKDIEDLQKNFDEKYGLGGVSDVLLTLAPFSKFEIGVSELFFDKDVGKFRLEYETIRKLKEYGEIKFKNGYYSIPHSTLARLYLETAMFKTKKEDYSYLTQKITKQLRNSELTGKIDQYPFELYKMYLLSKPRNLSEFMSQLGLPGDGFYFFEMKLLEDESNYKEFISQINDKDDLIEVSKCLQAVKLDKTRIFEDIDWKDLYRKFENAELWEIDTFLMDLHTFFLDSTKYETMLYKIFVDNISALKSKLEKASVEERLKFTITLAMKPFTGIVHPLIEYLDTHTLILGWEENPLPIYEREWNKVRNKTSKIKIKSLASGIPK